MPCLATGLLTHGERSDAYFNSGEKDDPVWKRRLRAAVELEAGVELLDADYGPDECRS
jgi:hypothetical protein